MSDLDKRLDKLEEIKKEAERLTEQINELCRDSDELLEKIRAF